tara:strand:- start:107 stop:427 length:321 start_codon:yes stop_codon:yes gene_type:complete
MIIYVDIDETICRYEGEREYSNALPVKENIEKINNLYDKGHEIVYWTARGSTTGIDWANLTATQLEKWNAKHTSLKLKKPHYDLFICDKAINSIEFFDKMAGKITT